MLFCNSAHINFIPLDNKFLKDKKQDPVKLVDIIPSVVQISSVQSLSRVQLVVIPRTTASQASLSITNFQSSLKLMSIESMMPCSHRILCHPLLLLPPIPLSIRVFSSESTFRMRWPKYLSISLSISPSNEYPGLISFRMDFFPLHFCCMIPTLTSSKIFYLIALCLVLPNPHPSFINSQWF